VKKLSGSSENIQCPCGREIENPEDYKVLYLKRELQEIDILCPNDSCYLRELGYVKFESKEGKAKFKEASFYPPFVTWNSGRIGNEDSDRLLKDHLKKIANRIDWERLIQSKKS
jgi:hypothetical protein